MRKVFSTDIPEMRDLALHALRRNDPDRDQASFTRLMEIFPVTAILGARQCGKTTMAGFFDADHLFDLENPRDMARLETPQLALEELAGLIVIDEIQRLDMDTR